VRVAGFAYDRMDTLSCVTAAIAADRVLGSRRARDAAGAALDLLLNRPFTDIRALDDPATRSKLVGHIRRVHKFLRAVDARQLPSDSLVELARLWDEAGPLVAELERRYADWKTARADLDRVFAADFEQVQRAIRTLYGDARLQEAVFIESPNAFDGVRSIIDAVGAGDASQRRTERVAAMYAQRFCAKNDTNSICGPVGAGFLGDADPEARIDIVTEDATRRTYFSHWAAQELLDEAVRRAGVDVVTWQIHPTARLANGVVSWCTMDHDATTLFRRRYARTAPSDAVLTVLKLLEQPRREPELLTLAAELELDRDELREFLEDLRDAGIVIRGPAVPPGVFYPLRAVADQVSKWPPGDAGPWVIAELAALEELVAAFGAAPLASRVEILGELAKRFVAATGKAASRNEGKIYADRSLIHEDVSVEVHSSLGPARGALEATLPALMAVLELPCELARERVREWFEARFGASTATAIDAHRAYDEDQPLATPAATPHAAALRDAIDRIRQLLANAAATAQDGIARLTSAELRTALDGVVAPSHPGYVSADAMLRRMPDGTVELVLGEVHGFFWLTTCLLDVVRDGDRIVEEMRAAVREMAAGTRTAECLFLHTQASDRRFALAETDLQLMVASDRPGSLNLGELDLALVAGRFVYTQGGAEVIPLVAYTNYPFIQYTSSIAPLFDDYAERFFPATLLPESLRGRDTPRIVLDDVVIQRRTWRYPVSGMKTAFATPDKAERFLAMQDLRARLGCDSRVFWSIPGEPKPIHFDFFNPLVIEAVATIVTRLGDEDVVKISEMLPARDELVAQGHDGARTSELRIGFYRT